MKYQNKLKIITLLFFIAAFSVMSACHKKTVDWTFCVGCQEEVWLGNYSGNGEYFKRSSNTDKVKNLPVDVSIEEIYGQTLKVVISSPKEFSFEFTGEKKNNDYSFNQSGSSKSMTLSLYQKAGEYKIFGTAKKYHIIKPDTVVVDESVSFEVNKTE